MTDLAPTSLPRPQGRRLSSRQKAAVVVQLLVSGGVDPGLRDLPPELQRQLVSDMAGLRFIDRETLATVVAEFAAELDAIGLHFPRDPALVIKRLETALDPSVLTRLAEDLGIDPPAGNGVWDSIAAQPDDAIVTLLTEESAEVAAILLGKLPASRAAILLGKMAPERAAEVSAAFARTAQVGPETVGRIGRTLGQLGAGAAKPAFETDAAARMGEIVNAATSGLRRQVLDDLDKVDAPFGQRVRAAVFSFDNIPDRLDPKDAPRILREIDSALVVTALAGITEEEEPVREFLFGNISARLADQIRDEIEERGTVPREDAEAAMAEIAATVRRLEEAGEISLLAPEG